MSKILDIPYLSQRDNKYNPSGSCNVTSIAMCLSYHGIKGDNSSPQLEDQLYTRCENWGLSRHDPNDLKELIERSYNGESNRPYILDNFTAYGTFLDIKQAINNNIPCVVHGYFTRFGHIITVIGYDDKGFIVNDPWGEFHYDGYDTEVSGEKLHYSYKLIAEVCSPESINEPKNIWLHRIERIR